MSVLTIHGKAIDWAHPPKANTIVKWSRPDMYGRTVIGSLRAIAHLDATDAAVFKKFGVHLVVIQPAFNTGVAASAGTHDYDMCFDVYIPGVAWGEQQKFFRAHGWGAYHRYPPKFGHHIHMFSLPTQEGKDRSDDYKSGGFKVGKYVDGGWSLFKRKTTSAQIEAYYAHRDALASNLRDSTWFPSDIKGTIFDLPAFLKKKVPVKTPSKTSKPVKSWLNASFQNGWGNSVEGGRTYKTRYPTLAKESVKGLPAIAAWAEVRPSQRGFLDREMAKYGYKRVAYDNENMLVVYVRPQVEVLGYSMARFSQQDGGNKEGVLRVKLRVGGSRFQIGVIHLDVDSSAAKKRSNVDEAYDALKRYGQTSLVPDWKSRTLVIGDWNKPGSFIEDLFKPLGFKKMSGSSGLDQAFVGAARADRGGTATKLPKSLVDHPRLLVRLGRK